MLEMMNQCSPEQLKVYKEPSMNLFLSSIRLRTKVGLMEAGKRAFAQRSEDQLMLIRYGYELTLNCPQPTMVVCLLDAHREWLPELRYEIPLASCDQVSARHLFSYPHGIIRDSSGQEKCTLIYELLNRASNELAALEWNLV
jgi:hypothetical protein